MVAAAVCDWSERAQCLRGNQLSAVGAQWRGLPRLLRSVHSPAKKWDHRFPPLGFSRSPSARAVEAESSLSLVITRNATETVQI